MRDVVVDGRVVVRDRVCTTVDAAELAELAARHQRQVLGRARITVPQRWPVIDGRAHFRDEAR